MKLELSQIKDITLGAVRVEEDKNGIHFYRFTRQQELLYQERSENFYNKTFALSGVRLRFSTNSQTLLLRVETTSVYSRTYFSFDVFVNGKKVDDLKNFSPGELSPDYTVVPFPLGEYEKTFDLGTGNKEVCIYFPWTVKVTLKELALDDDAFVKPVKPSKKMLCFGDSITQGYDVLYPSNKYVSKLADFLDAQEYNKAIGGEVFFPDLAATKEDFEPDYITVAYGSNDWTCSTREELVDNCRQFLVNLRKNYPNSKIFVITPIWRKDMDVARPLGEFLSVRDIIRSQTAGLENVYVIDGFEFVPQDETCFGDLRLHPNDKGFGFYFESLASQIKDILVK